ncbi:tRNA-modifying protein YgfZ [Vibrio sp. SCSIO 43137]|uniref:tRNA-modifying protein YgfZ n=1 Tax=Vibrio sp. SCSIO 43137 TaxID=3021011 RepID=UPI0023079AD1|nr:tRNA-modifying protein YgfZ [Vibrio sp. SCSIO 43137]WCE30161.1 tRNA-modifying protein YgfZ [Vibrio sp. SCSIO 43137]
MKWQDKFLPQPLNQGEQVPGLFCAHLTSWKAIQATGNDSKSYLQGQLTCDIVKLEADKSTLGAHCDAKGKVWSIFRLFAHNQGYALLQHASAVNIALAEIKKYAVFSKVDISISDEVVLGIMGEQVQSYINTISEGSGDVRQLQNGKGSSVKVDESRWILILDQQSAEELIAENIATENHAFTLTDESIWDKFDIENAIPRVTSDNQNEHIPQTFNLQALDGISFNKGCYTGQETVARAKYRGTNKRGMFIVQSEQSIPMAEKIILERSVGENWRNAGQLICQYQYADGKSIGLIILPNNLESDVKFRQADNPEIIWSLVDTPYSLED